MSQPDLTPDQSECCVICGRPATTQYPPGYEEAALSCGSISCELQMQAAEDYHDEHANGS